MMMSLSSKSMTTMYSMPSSSNSSFNSAVSNNFVNDLQNVSLNICKINSNNSCSFNSNQNNRIQNAAPSCDNSLSFESILSFSESNENQEYPAHCDSSSSSSLYSKSFYSKSQQICKPDEKENIKNRLSNNQSTQIVNKLSSESLEELELLEKQKEKSYYLQQYPYWSYQQQQHNSTICPSGKTSFSSKSEFSFSGWHHNRFSFNHHNNKNNNNNKFGNKMSRCAKALDTEISNNSCYCSLFEIEKQQSKLRLAIREVLASSPIIGLYKNEEKTQWNQFVSGLLQYFGGKANGARAKAAAQIRAAAENSSGNELKILLSSLGLQLEEISVKDIIQKCDILLAGSPLKRELETNLAQLKKVQSSLAELQQEGSKVRLGITNGLSKKLSKSEIQSRITKIIEGRIHESDIIQQKIENIRQRLREDERAVRVNRIRELLGENLMESEKQVGRDTQNSGSLFEQDIISNSNNCLKTILARIGKSQDEVNIFRGVKWENTDGEVDIVITDKQEKQILAIAEAKARVYDIAAAYRQSGSARSSSKKRLLIKGKAIETNKFTTPFFVVTTLPKNKISLPFESKLKDSLNKFFVSQEPENVNYEEVYGSLASLYSNLSSPLSWFDEYALETLVVAEEKAELTTTTSNSITCCSCCCITHCKSLASEPNQLITSFNQDTDTDTNEDFDHDSDDSRDQNSTQYSPWQILSSQASSRSVTEADEESENEQYEEDEEKFSETSERENDLSFEGYSKFSSLRNYLTESTPINEKLPNFKLFGLFRASPPSPHPEPQEKEQQQKIEDQQQQQEQQQQQQLNKDEQLQLQLQNKLLLQRGGGLQELFGKDKELSQENEQQLKKDVVVDVDVVRQISKVPKESEERQKSNLFDEFKGKGKGGKGRKGMRSGKLIENKQLRKSILISESEEKSSSESSELEAIQEILLDRQTFKIPRQIPLTQQNC